MGARLLLLAGVLVGVARAQSNTGSIAGHVSDPAGQAVAGAAVRVVNTDLGAERSTVSDERGDFRVDGLVPGALTVEAKGGGMATRRAARVTLGLGSTVRVSLELAVPRVETKTTVSGRRPTLEGNTVAPPVNKDEAYVSNFFAGQTVTYLPNRDRDFTQFGQLGGGMTEDAQGDGVVVAGQRTDAIITQVDGVSFNDALQGGRRGARDGTFFLPQTVVREFQIVRSGVAADVGGTNAGLINVATKEGSNRLHGESFYTVRPAWAASADAFGHKVQSQQNVFGASEGGAFRKDRVFFYAGFEQNFLHAPYFVQLEPQAAGVTVPSTLAGMEGEVAQNNTPTALFFRGDARMGKANTLNFVVAGNRLRSGNVGDGSTRAIAPVMHADGLSGQSVWVKGGLTTLLNERSVNVGTVSWTGDHRNFSPNTRVPERVINGFGMLGGDGLGPHVYASDQAQVSDTVSVSRGRVAVDVGGWFGSSPAYEEQEANRYGRFDYNSLADYVAGTARRYQQTFVTGDARYRGTVRALGLFVNGKMPLGKSVTMTAGLRWDGQWNPQPARANAAIAQTRVVPDDLMQWQPRVGMAWAAAAKTTVRVSAGMYAAPTPATVFHRVSTDNGLNTVVADSYFDPQVLALAGANGLTVMPAGLKTPAALVVGMDARFRNPRSAQVAGSVEQEISAKYAVSAGVVHESTWRLRRRVDMNLGAPTMGANGLPVFPAARPNAAVGRLLVNQSEGHSDYNGMLLSATAQVTRRSTLLANYTLSQTHDDDSGAGPFGIDAALNPFDMRAERAYSALDVRQVFNLSAIFDLPLGFKCNPLLLARSGRPYTPLVGFDQQRDANDWNDRAVVAGVVAGRDSMRQPAFVNLDLRIVKDFTLPGVGHHLDLFMDVFNVAGTSNRNFGPDGVSVFGTSALPVASRGMALFAPDATRLGGARALQFTARLVGF